MHTTRKIFRAYLTSQATQWTKEKVQKDNQRSTKHTYKMKDKVTRTPLKTRGELWCSGRLSSSCYTSGTHRVNLVPNAVNEERTMKWLRPMEHIRGHLWQIFHSDQPSHDGNRKTFYVMGQGVCVLRIIINITLIVWTRCMYLRVINITLIVGTGYMCP